MRCIIRWLREDDAATAVEYAVMLALILAVIISSIGVVGSQSGGMWGNVEGELTKAGFGS
jgi:pilus assembly protein Flp/PilA